MQIKKRDGQTYLAELTDDERQALLWSVEAGHALLLDDPAISTLRREKGISAGILDQLAATDRVFNFPATNDVVTLGDNPTANDGVSRVADAAIVKAGAIAERDDKAADHGLAGVTGGAGAKGRIDRCSKISAG